MKALKHKTSMTVPSESTHRARIGFQPLAFSLIELLCVIAIIGVLVVLMLPAVSRGKMRAQQVACLSNLKQMAFAFQNFAHEHNSRFPMQVATNDGGTEEFVQNGYRVGGDFYFSYRHFQALSNELVTTKAVVCPADVTRSPVNDFANLDSDNLSYFVNVAADYLKPETVLVGDRNLTSELSTNQTLLIGGSRTPIRWTSEMHRFRGNLLFSDGHAEACNSLYITNYLFARSDITLPTINPGMARSSVGVIGASGMIQVPHLSIAAGQSSVAPNGAGNAAQAQATPVENVPRSTDSGARASLKPVTQPPEAMNSESDKKPTVKPEIVSTTPGDAEASMGEAPDNDNVTTTTSLVPLKRRLFAMAQVVDEWPVWPWWLLLVLLAVIIYLRRRWSQYMQKKSGLG